MHKMPLPDMVRRITECFRNYLCIPLGIIDKRPCFMYGDADHTLGVDDQPVVTIGQDIIMMQIAMKNDGFRNRC